MSLIVNEVWSVWWYIMFMSKGQTYVDLAIKTRTCDRLLQAHNTHPKHKQKLYIVRIKILKNVFQNEDIPECPQWEIVSY